MRNPQIELNGKLYQTIGDSHLGRKYVNGVPLHMRGKIEEMQREKFESLLGIDGVQGYILVGDSFDDFIVDPTDVDYASSTILTAARNNPDRRVVVLGGNHDESKDLTRKSSFDNLKTILKEAALSNVSVIEEPTIIDGVGYISWSAKYSAKELAEQLVSKAGDERLAAVFGHWDVVLPSNANHYNMVPTDTLVAITNKVVTGHVHKPGVIERDGIEITMTGSIMPLAHGEETDEDELFYTITRQDYDADPAKYEGKFVRFTLFEDEELPDGNFLQIKAYVKPTKQSLEDDSGPTEFDISKILTKFLIDQEIAPDKTAEVVERFNAKQDRD